MTESSEDVLRKKNRAMIEKLFTSPFSDWASLFTDDPIFRLGFTNPIQQLFGIESLRKAFADFSKEFPDFRYTKFNIHSFADPNEFFVEDEGYGTVVRPGFPPITPKAPVNHVNIFVMQDGKIKMWTEYFDRYFAMKALGMDLPEF